MFNEAAAARLTSACFTPGVVLALCFFSSLSFFNDRCCVSATRGTRYVTFPAVSAAAVEAATTGTGIITGNSVCDTNQQNSAACCCQARLPFSVQVRLSVIGTQLSGTFHDQVNRMNLLFFCC